MNEPVPLGWAELDQLADWTEGLLTGPDANHITHLIATDPRWTHAHRALTLAQPALRTALHTAANALDAGPIPPDIAARIDHTLTHPPTTRRGAGRTVTGASGPGPIGPPAQRPPGRPPASRPARRRLVVALTALVLFAGIGGGALVRELLSGTRSASSPEAAVGGDGGGQSFAPTRPEATDRAEPPVVGTVDGYAASDQVDIYTSDEDYQHADLPALAAQWPGQRTSLGDELASAGYGSGIASLDGFRACVSAVKAAHPGDVTRALFARYAGAQALFLAITTAGTNLLVVVGPRCGQGTTDELDLVEG